MGLPILHRSILTPATLRNLASILFNDKPICNKPVERVKTNPLVKNKKLVIASVVVIGAFYVPVAMAKSNQSSLHSASVMSPKLVNALPSDDDLSIDEAIQESDDIPEEDGADNFEDEDGHIERIYQEPLFNQSTPINADSQISNVSPPIVKPADSKTVFTQSDKSTTESATLGELNSSDGNVVAQIPLNAISPMTLKTFVEVVDLVRREYVEPVSDEVLFNDAMSGMLSKLDSHAEFLDAEAYQNLRAFTQGDVGEVGLQARYQQSQGHWVVTAVAPNSPAADERIRVGDYIHQINETKLTERKTPNDVEQLLSGIAGTQVELVVSREGRRKRTITLQRNQTRQQQIGVKIQEGIAIVRLPVFQNNSRQKLLTSLAGLKDPVSGIIIDVRDNPGGVLESAIDIAGLFMADKTAVQVKGRQGIERTIKTANNAILENIPVMILQNRYSASAAEVLASSLQTQKRAMVVGETSYGKGSVQSVIPVNDEQAIKLTVAYYLTADSRQIDDIGITPDISLTGEEDLWEQQAVTLLLAQDLPPGVNFVLKDAE